MSSLSNQINPGIPSFKAPSDEPISSDDVLSGALLARLSDPEIRAIASDRGYELPEGLSRSRLREAFLHIQARDHISQ